jgi:hypothetical protein
VRYVRFHEDHQDANLHKKRIINELPSNLQKGLVRHLYSREVSRVPIFAHIGTAAAHVLACLARTPACVPAQVKRGSEAVRQMPGSTLRSAEGGFVWAPAAQAITQSCACVPDRLTVDRAGGEMRM